jgi:transposase
MRAEEKRQEARGKRRRKKKSPSRRGRMTTAAKIARAKRTEKVFPTGVPKSDCKLSHTRVVWRLENGQAVLIAYEVYRGPMNEYGQIPGSLGRSEFALEIIIAIAYQVYVVGLSFDKVCLLFGFFQNLKLRKSQVDSLLNQLSRHWESEFDFLCTLLANSLVVNADETSWSINSVWAFLSEKVRILFFGVHKDAATLKAILDPDTFKGLVTSDDAAVYANFSLAQKCWAHLLRKAIKLTLQAPDNAAYREFTDRLLEIYRLACRVQSDKRYSDVGRAAKVGELDDAILDLCLPFCKLVARPSDGPKHDFCLLVNELLRLMFAQQLFTFVTAAPMVMPHGETVPVAGTNNEAERTLRNPSVARDTGRTNKTARGARRQTIVHSVLESLRRQLTTFTISTVIDEILRWSKVGKSCFAELVSKLKLPMPAKSILDRLLPKPGS